MDKVKVVNTPLTMHFKLSTKHCPSSDGEKGDMKKVPYALAVDSLMYVMVCTRTNISHAVGIVSHFFLIQEENIRMLWSELWDTLWHF